MKITLEAEVMGQHPEVSTPSLSIPGHCAVQLTVKLGHGGGGFGPFGAADQVFEQVIILREDEVQSHFDLLMKNLTRNMRNILVSYLEDHSSLEKLPLMPVLKFERMRR